MLTMMILPIITLLSITEATEVLCTKLGTKNITTFTLKLRDEIANTLKEIKTSEVEDLQCPRAEVQG